MCEDGSNHSPPMARQQDQLLVRTPSASHECQGVMRHSSKRRLVLWGLREAGAGKELSSEMEGFKRKELSEMGIESTSSRQIDTCVPVARVELAGSRASSPTAASFAEVGEFRSTRKSARRRAIARARFTNLQHQGESDAWDTEQEQQQMGESPLTTADEGWTGKKEGYNCNSSFEKKDGDGVLKQAHFLLAARSTTGDTEALEQLRRSQEVAATKVPELKDAPREIEVLPLPNLRSFPIRTGTESSDGCWEHRQEVLHMKPLTAKEKAEKAARMHRESEKRRRRKLNQGMHRLKEILPKKVKGDKAAILDEVIIYMNELLSSVSRYEAKHKRSRKKMLPSATDEADVHFAVPGSRHVINLDKAWSDCVFYHLEVSCQERSTLHIEVLEILQMMELKVIHLEILEEKGRVRYDILVAQLADQGDSYVFLERIQDALSSFINVNPSSPTVQFNEFNPLATNPIPESETCQSFDSPAPPTLSPSLLNPVTPPRKCYNPSTSFLSPPHLDPSQARPFTSLLLDSQILPYNGGLGHPGAASIGPPENQPPPDGALGDNFLDQCDLTMTAMVDGYAQESCASSLNGVYLAGHAYPSPTSPPSLSGLQQFEIPGGGGGGGGGGDTSPTSSYAQPRAASFAFNPGPVDTGKWLWPPCPKVTRSTGDLWSVPDLACHAGRSGFGPGPPQGLVWRREPRFQRPEEACELTANEGVSALAGYIQETRPELFRNGSYNMESDVQDLIRDVMGF